MNNSPNVHAFFEKLASSSVSTKTNLSLSALHSLPIVAGKGAHASALDVNNANSTWTTANSVVPDGNIFANSVNPTVAGNGARANASRVSAESSSEHLNNALIDYHTIASLIQEGKTHEAQAVASYALENLSKCSGCEQQLLPLISAFVQLFEHKNMTAQASAFRAKEQTFCGQLAATSGLTRNVWGA